MAELRTLLDERRNAERLAETERRGRAAFLEGAEAQSQGVEGWPLPADQLTRVVRRYRTDGDPQ